MQRIIAIVLLLSFAAPANAGIMQEFDPVEKDLVEQDLDRMMKDSRDAIKEKKQPAIEPMKTEAPKEKKSGTRWWLWALGILVVGGGIAAAAGGGGGGGNDSGGGDTGTVTVSW